MKALVMTNTHHWRPLSWSEAKKGQPVWLRGTHDGVFRAYGPHIVHDTERRQLESGTPERKGQVFTHYAEELLVPEETPEHPDQANIERK